jgi:hypothetical protein
MKDPRFQILNLLVARKVERYFVFVFFPIINIVFLFYAVNKILNIASSLSAFYVLALLVVSMWVCRVTSHVNKPKLELPLQPTPRRSRDVKNGTDSMAPPLT